MSKVRSFVSITSFVSLSVILVAATAFAESDAIAKRRKILKGIGEATRPVALILKGNAPFDLAVVKATLAKYSEGSKALPKLFPPDSKTGGETEALPIIWDEKPKFDALFDKLDTEATAASQTIVDDASFKATMPKVLGTCKSCHDTYREKK